LAKESEKVNKILISLTRMFLEQHFGRP